MSQYILQNENQKMIYFKDSMAFNSDDYANNVIYDFCYKNINTKLYYKKIRLSIIIDLEKDIDTIFNDFKPNTRNEINKAIKLNLSVDYNIKLMDLFKKHNEMLDSKGLEKINESFYFGLPKNPVITSTYDGGGNSFIYNR